MTLEKMWELQHKLDKERLDCPRCGEPTTWEVIHEWGSCLDCVAQIMNNPDDVSEEYPIGKRIEPYDIEREKKGI